MTNVLLILADDLGYSDVAPFGGEIETPALDALATDGARFSQFYNTARCSPSRASLLTGLHPHQTGIGVLTRPDLAHGYPGDLDPDSATLAEILHGAGWQTWMAGKWHLSSTTHTPTGSWPTRRGFDRFFGTIRGCSSYFEPQTLFRDEAPAHDAIDDPDFYYTDAISDEAVRWVSDNGGTADAAPFFLYVAYTAPHWPLHARAEDIERYAGTYLPGWDSLRAQRLGRLVEKGILPAGTSLSPRDPSQPEWDDVDDKEWQASRMAVYAAQVDRMDQGIGRIIAALKETGQYDDTLIMFLSDNGGSSEELPIGDWESFRRKDEVLQKDATRSGQPIRVGNTPDIVPGDEATYSSYGIPWANLSNTPFRRYKRWVHEGGISTPLIVHWTDGGVRANQVIHASGQLVDVLPTVLDAVGIEGHPGLQGRSLLPALRGDELRDEPLFWEHVGNAAIREGDWKLVRAYPADWELYNLRSDRAELHDRRDEHPEIARTLEDKWRSWADAVGVIPWDDMAERYVLAGLSAAAAEE